MDKQQNLELSMLLGLQFRTSPRAYCKDTFVPTHLPEREVQQLLSEQKKKPGPRLYPSLHTFQKVRK